LDKKRDALIALGAMEESGLSWDMLTTKRDSLEDIFVRMVGGKSEEPAGPEETP
jgi:hypothetical protein